METIEEKKQALEELTPREIVNRLDTYIVGQQKAKKSVAIALRNRTRRLKLPEDIRDEIAPKNILMIGPTGVGKTEIARRLAKLCGAPFLKVEATKYTEVGYVGRDVESMIRDLMAVGYKMVKSEMQDDMRVKAEEKVEDALLDLLLPGSGKDTKKKKTFFGMGAPVQNPENLPAENEAEKSNMAETREKFRVMLREGKLEDRTVEVVASRGNKMPTFEIFAGGNSQPDWNEASVTVDDIHLQRRIELWGEGFAYYDLKRLNKGIDRTYEGNNYMPSYNIAVPARDTRWIYQIPLKEIQENDMINEEDQNVL